LQLTDEEVFETKTAMYVKLALGSFGVLSALIATLGLKAWFFSGIIYSLSGIPVSILQKRRAKIYKKKYAVARVKSDV